MQCNLRPPEPRQSFSALITTPCQVWRRWTYPLPYYSVLAADTLLYVVTSTFNSVTLTFDLEHLQCIVCDVMTLPTKYERNRAIGSGVIAISIFVRTLHVAFGSWIIFTKFDIPCLIYSVFDADTLCHALTLWPWPLTSWPLTCIALQASCVWTLFKIWAKSINPQLNYRQFSTFLPCNFMGWDTFTQRFSRVRGSNFTKLGRGIWGIIPTQEVCFRFSMTCCICKCVRLKVKSCFKRHQILHFLTPPVKIRGGVGEISIQIVEALPPTEPPNTFDGHPLRGCRARWVDKERKKKERKFMGKT